MDFQNILISKLLFTLYLSDSCKFEAVSKCSVGVPSQSPGDGGKRERCADNTLAPIPYLCHFPCVRLVADFAGYR